MTLNLPYSPIVILLGKQVGSIPSNLEGFYAPRAAYTISHNGNDYFYQGDYYCELNGDRDHTRSTSGFVTPNSDGSITITIDVYCCYSGSSGSMSAGSTIDYVCIGKYAST